MLLRKEALMPKYVIERTLPGAGKLSEKELHAIAVKSNAVLRDLGQDIQWVQSYVTGDKIYCVYNARSSELVREHARCGGFPVDSVNEVKAIIDPVTGDAR
jgi:hypothetical protein